MFRIFNLTREQLDSYVGKGMDSLYNQVKGDTNALVKRAKSWGPSIKKAWGKIRKK